MDVKLSSAVLKIFSNKIHPVRHSIVILQFTISNISDTKCGWLKDRKILPNENDAIFNMPNGIYSICNKVSIVPVKGVICI